MWILIFSSLTSNKPWGFWGFDFLATVWWSACDKLYMWGKNKILFAACRLNNSFKEKQVYWCCKQHDASWDEGWPV